MLWSEKIWFVKETMERNYLPSDSGMYGWCDIGYFRNRSDDLHTDRLARWANPEKIASLDKTKISYALVNNHTPFLKNLSQLVRRRNERGLPVQPIPPFQVSIGGNMFLLHRSLVPYWAELYESRLALYFQEGYLVKDDQIILADCIFSDTDSKFALYQEQNPSFDNWFMFQRILL
jgi:hypothetical protein